MNRSEFVSVLSERAEVIMTTRQTGGLLAPIRGQLPASA